MARPMGDNQINACQILIKSLYNFSFKLDTAEIMMRNLNTEMTLIISFNAYSNRQPVFNYFVFIS